MRRILIISQVPPPTHGSTLMTETFLSTLAELGVEVALVDRRFSATVESIGRFSLRKVLSALYLPLRLLREVLIFKPDKAVFFVTNRKLSFLVDCALAVILRMTRTPSIHYIHTVGFTSLSEEGPIWRKMVGFLLSQAKKIVCLGPTLFADIEPWVSEGSVEFIPNAATVPEELRVRVPSAGTSLSGGPSVLFLSNLIPEKGPLDFIDMAAKIIEKVPGVSFVIAGADASEDFTRLLKLRVREHGLEDAIDFAGPVNPTEKWKLLQSSAVLVFPSTYRFEAQPLTIVEALEVGTSVVAYDTGGIRDLMVNQERLLVVKAGDVGALSKTVERLLGQEGDELVKANLGGYPPVEDMKRYGRQWEKVLSCSML